MLKKQIKKTLSSKSIPPPQQQETEPQVKKRANHHDIFFKNIYSDPVFAQELLTLIFTKEELSFFDLKNLKAEKDSLNEKRADLIFSLPLKNQPQIKVQIFILLEHKSYYDPKLFSQGLFYQTILHEGSFKSDLDPPIVIPALFYHGKIPWKWATSFQENAYKGFLSKIPAGLRKSMINYEMKLLDVNKLTGALFKNKNFKSRGALYLLKQIWNLQLTPNHFKDVMSRFGEFSGDKKKDQLILNAMDYLEAFFYKNSEKFKLLWQKVEKELIEEGVFKRGGYMGIVKQIEERGHIKGWRKCRQEIILNMLKKNLDIKLVSEVTGLSAKEIKKLKNGS